LAPFKQDAKSAKKFQLIDGNGSISAELLAASGIEMGSDVAGEINDGTVLYIDPNDPQAAALLQQAGKAYNCCTTGANPKNTQCREIGLLLLMYKNDSIQGAKLTLDFYKHATQPKTKQS
jgi:hypothetical protein